MFGDTVIIGRNPSSAADAAMTIAISADRHENLPANNATSVPATSYWGWDGLAREVSGA
ncbi:hypothetical protein KQH49_13965 [Mycetohabitans sp. B5]|nr:hypothetical protein [Mycetohabitans sp. B5]